jgi:hypothetical protein
VNPFSWSFHSPVPWTTLAYAAAGAAALTAIAYILKIRRRRFEVPFSTLWQRVLEQRDANALWKHLKRILSLLLMLVLLGLIFLAALDPKEGGRNEEARSVVILIDTSASMKAVDEVRPAADEDAETEADKAWKAKISDPQARAALEVEEAKQRAADPASRMEIAKRAAMDVIDSMGGDDLVMIMRLDGQATPLTRFESDKALLRRTVSLISASDTPADLHRALSAAGDALRDRQNPMIVLISDGAYGELDLGQVRWGKPAEGAEASAPPPPAAGGAAPPPADLPGDDEIAARRKVYEKHDLSVADLTGIDVHYVPVGKRADNVGIIAFNVRRYVANKAAYEMFVEVQNFGTTSATRKLTLYSGDREGSSAIYVSKPFTLEAGQKLRMIYPDDCRREVVAACRADGGSERECSLRGDQQCNLSGGAGHRLRAALRAPEDGNADPFALDDEAFALLPERKRQKVLLVTDDNLYLEGAMLVYDNIEVFKITPAEYDADPDGQLEDIHVVVFDDHTPKEIPPPPVHAIYFHPDPEGSPVKITRSVERPPRITDIAEHHPVMRWIQLSDVNFDESRMFAPDREQGELAIATSVRDVVMVAKREGGRKMLVVGFSLGGTDLTLRVAFPLLLVNTLDWFAGDDADLVTTYVTGRRLRVPLDGVVGVTEADVVGPDGKVAHAPVVDGVAQFYGGQIGFHEIKAYLPPPPGQTRAPDAEPIATREIAANLASPEESRIEPAAELHLGGRKLEAPPPARVFAPEQRFWHLILIVILILLGIEWITYHRRITV